MPGSSAAAVKSLTSKVQAIQISEDVEKEKLWKDAEKELPAAPKVNQKGKNVPQGPRASEKSPRVHGNFFKLELGHKVKICRYSVTIGDISSASTNNDPASRREIKPATKRYMVEQIVNGLQGLNRNVVWASDYESTVISAGQLSNHRDSPRTELPVNHFRTDSHGNATIPVRSSLTFLGVVNTQGLENLVRSTTVRHDLHEDIRAIHIIATKRINDSSYIGGRVNNKFFPDAMQSYAKNPRADWRRLYLIKNGFFCSVRPGQGSLLLNVNTATSIFYKPILLQEWIESCWGNRIPSSDDFRSRLRHVKVVLRLHSTGRQRQYAICDISNFTVARQTFEDDNKNKVTVGDYLKQKYTPYNSRYNPKSYCINVGTRNHPVWFPDSELDIVPWQVVVRGIPDGLKAELIRAAEKKPGPSKAQIRTDALSCLGIQPLLPFFGSFGLRPSPEFVTLIAPSLTPPTLNFRVEKTTNSRVMRMFQGGWNFKVAHDLKFIQNPGVNFTKLTVLAFEDPQVTDLSSFNPGLDGICRQLVARGVTISSTVARFSTLVQAQQGFQDTSRPSYRQDCINALHAAAKYRWSAPEKLPPGPVLVILPSNAPNALYAAVKRWGDSVEGLATTCVKAEKLLQDQKDRTGREDTSFWDNICLKIHAKLNGQSHELRGLLELPARVGSRTMIVGADVTHPPQGSGCPSIAGVVATASENPSFYYASARLQKGKQEYIQDLRGMMKERLLAWLKSGEPNPRDKLPTHILFYRDGVSESQFGMVRHEELRQIQEACQDVLKSLPRLNNKTKEWVPQITLLVAIKRHHARFYTERDPPMEPSRGDEVNLPMGTVADTVVVTPNHHSFYLQSHRSQLGTARSTLYVVIHDTAGFSTSELEAVTNNLCYTGSRAMKAISICTPARYADLLCDRLRLYLKPYIEGRHQPENLKKKLVDGVEENADPLLFANDPILWRLPGQNNPWDKKLDRVMFYL